MATTTPDGSRKEASFPIWGKLLLVMCAIMFFVSSLFMGYCSYRIMSDTSVIRNANSVDEEWLILFLILVVCGKAGACGYGGSAETESSK